jgi:hypothetical protein
MLPRSAPVAHTSPPTSAPSPRTPKPKRSSNLLSNQYYAWVASGGGLDDGGGDLGGEGRD